MSGFTADDWAALAAVSASFLTDRCAISPNVAATPGDQGSAQSWPSVSATVDCALIKGGGATGAGEVPDQGWMPGHHVLVVPTGTTLAEPYRVAWTGRTESLTLEIVGEVRQHGTDATAIEADCVEVPA